MNLLTLQPFQHFNEDIRPPAYIHEIDKGYIEPQNDQIISLRKDIVLSYYGDNIWDLTPYSKDKMIINFNSILTSSLIIEAKRLLFLYMTYGEGRGKTIPSGRTISIKFQIINNICSYAYKRNKSLKDILSDKKLFRIFIIEIMHTSPSTACTLKTIIELLKGISKERSGFIYESNKLNENLLASIDKKYKDSLEQTLMIPVSIYLFSAKARWENISFIERYLTNLIGFLQEFIRNKGFAVNSIYDVPKENKKDYVSWKEGVKKFELEELFSKYNINSRKEFQGLIAKIQGTCRHLIHQYTGMRSIECRSLTFDCWREKTSNMPTRIFGYESKIHGSDTTQVWITHPEIKRVISLLNAITKPMQEAYCPHLEIYPLMIRTGFMNSKIKGSFYEELIPNDKNLLTELPIKESGIIISKEHIEEELKAIEPNRNWKEHEWIEEGSLWRFKSHQYRRTLAIFALGSGLVSLYAIREQFGHLLTSMARYYGYGYKSARQLDGKTNDKEHISNYMQQIKDTVNSLSYLKNVVLSESLLLGSNGSFLEKNITARTLEDKNAAIEKVPELIKKFKNGILHYKETAMGGCTTPYTCENYLLPDFFIYCKGCEYSIHKIEKIERLAKKQYENTIKWEKKAPNSIEHRTCVKRLVAINEFKDIMLKKIKKHEEKKYE
jgi:integrase